MGANCKHAYTHTHTHTHTHRTIDIMIFAFSALTRPGRFDVEVTVLPPDVKGRKEIFELYLSKVKIAKGKRTLAVSA